MTSAPKVLSELPLRFKSGNDVPVERAYIKREEWDELLRYIHMLEVFHALHVGSVTVLSGAETKEQ